MLSGWNWRFSKKSCLSSGEVLEEALNDLSDGQVSNESNAGQTKTDIVHKEPVDETSRSQEEESLDDDLQHVESRSVDDSENSDSKKDTPDDIKTL